MEKKKVQQRTIESRKKIDKAALALFMEKGYFNTNTKEIAKRAGISVGNFYNYYKDKGDVYYTLARRYVEGSNEALEHLSDAMIHASDPRKTFADYVYSQMERAVGSGQFFADAAVLGKDSVRLQEVLEQGTDAIIEKIEWMITHINNHGIIKRAEYPIMARLLFEMVDKLTQEVMKMYGTPIYREYLDQVILVVENYLFGEENATAD